MPWTSGDGRRGMVRRQFVSQLDKRSNPLLLSLVPRENPLTFTSLTMNDIIEGVLLKTEQGCGVRTEDGETFFTQDHIWSGYIKHFQNQKVYARALPQTDYKTGRPIVFLWPNELLPQTPYVEIYFNEPLAAYLGSFFGHAAVNVNGRAFNFARKKNENEELAREEYFYRPARGEFAPAPKGGYDISDAKHPYYDKFGRRFMRKVYVLRITGLQTADTDRLAGYYRQALTRILERSKNSGDENPDFRMFSNNCVAELQKGLSGWGLPPVHRWIPKTFFEDCAREFYRLAPKRGWTISVQALPQLIVPEAKPSRVVIFSKLLSEIRPQKYFQ